MIQGLGIDAIEIDRFAHWHMRNPEQLARIFSTQEITYCLANKKWSGQRFAGRFAAKEAFFKSWNSALPEHYVPFLTICKAISIEHGDHHAPKLAIAWHYLPRISPIITPLISLTHTRTLAIACVTLNIQIEKGK